MAVLNCLASSGAIIYSPDGNYGTDGSGGGYGGSGGVGGGGRVWSDSEQLIWISINEAPKYPVWLKPGWNDVHFWIPFIFPDDEWVEAPIIIEAPGYILIPAGFEFNIRTDKNAPVEPGNPKMVDKLEFIDVYDYDIQSLPVSVDLDGIYDEIVFEDTHSIDIVAISNIVDEGCIESLTIEDINDYDITKTELINTTLLNDNNIEDISFTDIVSTTKTSVSISNQLESEDVGFEDFVQIEKS